MTLIALEEHYAWDPANVGNVVGACTARSHPVRVCSIHRTGPWPSGVDHGRQDLVDVADSTAEWISALENVCTTGCHGDQFG
jgi:hypothetical protein